MGTRRRYFPSFIATALWVLPVMAVVAGGGFFLALLVLAPHFLEPSTVHSNRPRPVRILSPDEAARAAQDEESVVWTQGVDKSKLPRLDNNDPSTRPRRRQHRDGATATPRDVTTATPAAPNAAAADADADATGTASDAPTDNAPPAQDTPPTDTGDGASPTTNTL